MIFYDFLNSKRQERKPEEGEMMKGMSDRTEKAFGRSLFLDDYK